VEHTTPRDVDQAAQHFCHANLHLLPKQIVSPGTTAVSLDVTTTHHGNAVKNFVVFTLQSLTTCQPFTTLTTTRHHTMSTRHHTRIQHRPTSSNIDKLQRVQNTLARVVSTRSRVDHTTPLLADLQWLPVRYRIEYKLVLITFKVLTRQELQYLAELIRMYKAPQDS